MSEDAHGDEYEFEPDETADDVLANRAARRLQEVQERLYTAQEAITTDLKAIFDTEEPSPVVVLAIAGDTVHAQLSGTMEQVKSMSLFLARELRIKELEAELAALKG